jgi:hypothetical protein
MADTPWSSLYDSAAEEMEPLSNGDYNFEVVTSQFKKASTGKDMFVIKAAVTDGPEARKTVWHNFVVSKDSADAMQVFFRNMDALGLGRDFWRTNPDNDAIVKALKGRRFRGTTKLRTWQGQDRPEFQRMSKLGAGSGAAAPPPPPGAAAPPPPPPAAAAPPAPPAPAAAPPAPPAAEPTATLPTEVEGAPVTPASPPPPPPAPVTVPDIQQEADIPAPPPPPSF